MFEPHIGPHVINISSGIRATFSSLRYQLKIDYWLFFLFYFMLAMFYTEPALSGLLRSRFTFKLLNGNLKVTVHVGTDQNIEIEQDGDSRGI